MDLQQAMDHAQHVVYGMYHRLPPWELEDAMADAYLGLVKASRDFREDGGASFRTYSTHRIKGNIKDGLRSRTPGRRTPNGFEKANVDPLSEWHDPPDQTNPYKEILDAAQRKTLVEAINRLKPREKMIITLYFFEGVTMQEIGDLYGFSESRSCQIVSDVVQHLRRLLSPALSIESESKGKRSQTPKTQRQAASPPVPESHPQP